MIIWLFDIILWLLWVELVIAAIAIGFGVTVGLPLWYIWCFWRRYADR